MSGNPSSFDWLQAGGLGLFATAVLVELRAIRPILTDTVKVLASLLERDRMREILRDNRRQSGDTKPPPLTATPVEIQDETTDRIEIAVPLQRNGRAATPAKGVPVGGLYSKHRRGTTHGDR